MFSGVVSVALKVFEAHQQSFILRDVQGCVRQATTGCPPHLAIYLEACSCTRSLASVFLHPRPRLPHVAVSAEEDASVSGGFLWFASSLLLLLLLAAKRMCFAILSALSCLQSSSRGGSSVFVQDLFPLQRVGRDRIVLSTSAGSVRMGRLVIARVPHLMPRSNGANTLLLGLMVPEKR